MKMRRFIIAALATAMTVGSVMTASAAWVQDGANWKYQNDNGTWQAGNWFKDADGRWYHFDANGIMQKGWYQDTDSKWYFMAYNGVMQVGLIKVNNAVYYMEADGSLFVGDKSINGTTYTFGLYGTTNGAPYVAADRTYGSNGNQTIIDNRGSSDGGNGGTTTTPEEAAKDVEQKVESLKTEYAKTIDKAEVDIKDPKAVKVAVTAKAGIDLSKDTDEKAELEKAIKSSLDTILEQTDDQKVTYNGMPIDSGFDIAKRLTQANLNANKGKTVTVEAKIGGQTVKYSITLN